MEDIVRKEIGGIKFGLFSPDVIRRMSAMEILVPELYDQDGFPVEGGLMDPRLGVVDPGMRCRTCAAKVGSCPGHFGHIEVAKPSIHVRFGKEIYNWLTAMCHNCGRIKITKEKRERFFKLFKLAGEEGTNKDKTNLMKDIIVSAKAEKACQFCTTAQPKVEWEKPTTYFMDGEKITPAEVREYLEKIPDEDLPLLGIDVDSARPEWSILTAMLVPPVTARPSITLETGERSEDDMTHKLVDIMRINTRLKENMASGAPAVIIEDFWELLQYHVTTLIDNEVSGVPPARHRAGRQLKGIVQRIKTKEGRFRRNLAGKRVNFSARTVISPDSDIGVDEVGVPYEIGKILTIPVYVTDENIDWLRSLVKLGSE
ncbi:MAG: DNA-directed RNA polymerase subunit A', partial [Candidatus Altiarchaeota archaeon]|nr:DNA-directed RNA polymerase subunit A' [Candidatus Altiarchaeota archaeon]